MKTDKKYLESFSQGTHRLTTVIVGYEAYTKTLAYGHDK